MTEQVGSEGTEAPQRVPLVDLKDQYLHAESEAGFNSSLPEKQAETPLRRARGQEMVGPLFAQMIDQTAQELIETPSDKRLAFLSDVRAVLNGDPYNHLSMQDMTRFTDELITAALEKMTPKTPQAGGK